MRGITEGRLIELKKLVTHRDTVMIFNILIGDCTELNQWLPIDENTPRNKPLLIAFDDGEIQIGIMRETESLGIYWEDVDQLDFNYGIDIPLYYQELPQPPKENKK